MADGVARLLDSLVARGVASGSARDESLLTHESLSEMVVASLAATFLEARFTGDPVLRCDGRTGRDWVAFRGVCMALTRSLLLGSFELSLSLISKTDLECSDGQMERGRWQLCMHRESDADNGGWPDVTRSESQASMTAECISVRTRRGAVKVG